MPPLLWMLLVVAVVCLCTWLLVSVIRGSSKALPESKPLKPPGTYVVDSSYPPLADLQTREFPLDDISDDYDIVEFPSTGHAFYMPKFKGSYISTHYRSSASDTTRYEAYGIRCDTKEHAIREIRDHMVWKAPRPLPRDKWKD